MKGDLKADLPLAERQRIAREQQTYRHLNLRTEDCAVDRRG